MLADGLGFDPEALASVVSWIRCREEGPIGPSSLIEDGVGYEVFGGMKARKRFGFSTMIL